MAIPRTLYAIAYGDNWLQSTNYNRHYMIYSRRKNSESIRSIKKEIFLKKKFLFNLILN